MHFTAWSVPGHPIPHETTALTPFHILSFVTPIRTVPTAPWRAVAFPRLVGAFASSPRIFIGAGEWRMLSFVRSAPGAETMRDFVVCFEILPSVTGEPRYVRLLALGAFGDS